MNEMKSSSVTLAPILACINAGTDFIEQRCKVRPQWLGGQVAPEFRCNDIDGDQNKQNAFLKEIVPLADDIVKIPELETIADVDVEVINQFLRDRNFSIQLEPFFSPFSIGVASVLHLLSQWSKPGHPWTVYSDNKKYPGARIKDHVNFYQISPKTHGEEIHPHPIACLSAQNGDKYFMTRMDCASRNEILLLNVIKNLESRMTRIKDYGAVIFPQIDFVEKPDITWLCGMHENDTGLDYFIRQAIQETKFKMNHIGAEVKSAAAMEFAASGCSMVPDAPRPDLVINKPFLLWIKRDGIKLPLFIGHLFQDCWKDPNAESRRSFV